MVVARVTSAMAVEMRIVYVSLVVSGLLKWGEKMERKKTENDSGRIDDEEGKKKKGRKRKEREG